jgi:Fe-S oxidoreductase
MIHFVAYAILLFAALGFFAFSSFRLVKYLSLGVAENRFDAPAERLKNVLVVALGQSKLLREPLAGLMHFCIFWGFVILLTAILEALIQGFVPEFTLQWLGPLFPALAALQEAIAILVVLACVLGLARWWLFPPKRYFGPEISAHVRFDATLILAVILTIMVSMLGSYAARMSLSGDGIGARFISSRCAGLFADPGQALIWDGIFWWIHILAVLTFLNYLPYSKHLHILTAVPNVFFASLKPRGELPKLDLENENVEKFGAEDVRDLTWKQLLDGMACTDCGRCTSVCPAHQTGKILSPRKIMMNIRERTSELAPVLLKGRESQADGITRHRLLGPYVKDEELWACTSCRACMEECPVMIEHVPTIVQMRRFLVLNESRFPSELTATYKNLETNFSPWAFSHESRADWAKDLDVTTMEEAGGETDVLYWVGCAGSYDQRYQKVSRAMVKLMNAAGVRFAILGAEEKCNGDVARRSGNEYLAQMLMTENVATLNKYRFKRILATCPHCYNTLKNEYPQFGGSYQVTFHMTFLDELVQSGRLKVDRKALGTVVYHDPCYAGRYNGVYAAPRRSLAACGATLAEMRRSRDRAFCCGAGGGQMFMEEKVGKRVNIERTEQALQLNPRTIAAACPFCMTMLTDGVKAKDADEKVQVRDVAEILADALG